VRGQDSKGACCKTEVLKLACGSGAAANVCLKSCDEAVPPCIMGEKVFVTHGPSVRNARDDCDKAVADWRKSVQILTGKKTDEEVADESGAKDEGAKADSEEGGGDYSKEGSSDYDEGGKEDVETMDYSEEGGKGDYGKEGGAEYMDYGGKMDGGYDY